jgi:phosphoribosylformimino-5-aminoimidazole carboxamide ribotide isomerase
MRIWDIYPAIDLRQGRVVRLAQGDPNRETEYADDPLRVAQRWQRAGAKWLHVVNLDGAFGEQSRENQDALVQILTTGLLVQHGGGMRDLGAIRRALELGVSRVVVGTLALDDPAQVEAALETFGPERIALGIDARSGTVRTHGWKKDTPVTAVELGQQWAARGARWAIFTDVARDGVRTGLNLEATVELAQTTGLRTIASGGVASLEDVKQAYHAGLSGAIIGRGLYESEILLEDALRVSS